MEMKRYAKKMGKEAAWEALESLNLTDLRTLSRDILGTVYDEDDAYYELEEKSYLETMLIEDFSESELLNGISELKKYRAS